MWGTVKDEEPCPKCVANIAMGFFFKICNESLSSKLDCKELSERYLRGEISEDQVAETINDAARADPELMEDLNEIDRIRKTRRIKP
ncbi:hypothetical protein MUP77_21210 [Candidatus Bathyarchaeota archaeon]|nr:hypothetical protein [Candidatus Bathyarchaeota archaeon]